MHILSNVNVLFKILILSFSVFQNNVKIAVGYIQSHEPFRAL